MQVSGRGRSAAVATTPEPEVQEPDVATVPGSGKKRLGRPPKAKTPAPDAAADAEAAPAVVEVRSGCVAFCAGLGCDA